MTLPLELKKDPRLSDKLIAGILILQNLNCQKFNKELWSEINKLEDHYRNEYDSPSEALEILKPARDLYRAVGIEPTRIRPSSEALLRRIIKGKPLYQINSIVDAGNLASVSFMLPIGLYDLSRIRGTVTFRLGREEESYTGIGKDQVNVSGRFTLADQEGPFGNPSSDSLRTSISLETRAILLVIFAPEKYSLEKLQDHLIFSRNIFLSYHESGYSEYLDILL